MLATIHRGKLPQKRKNLRVPRSIHRHQPYRDIPIQDISRLLKKGVHVRNMRFRSLKPWSYWRKLCRSHGTFSPSVLRTGLWGGAGHR